MQQQPRLPLWFLIANWALMFAAFFLGYLLQGMRHPLPEPQRSAMELVYQEVMRSHIEPPAGDELLERTIAGMVGSLDEYSLYIPPKKAAEYDEESTGNYQGIGITMFRTPEGIVLGCPFDGGPADRAGLLPGDLLVSVDGTAIDSEERQRSASDLVRGPADTDVRLVVQRDGERLEKVVRRGDVRDPCVKWAHFVDRESGLGYLHLAAFHPTAAEQVLAAIERLEQERPLRGLVIDLRFDGGGSLDACLSIARAFLPSGIIATQRRRGGEIVETYETDPKQCRYPDLPLVLLVNGHSASASEVLSGALQDHGRAAVVGERTYGKGYVNTVYSWGNHDFRLKLTTGTYTTPNGRHIERSYRTSNQAADAEQGGIPPDVVVALDKERARAVQLGLDAREPAARFVERFTAVATRYGLPVPTPPNPADDSQLATAIDTLRTRAK